jgi:hypothetical protein
MYGQITRTNGRTLGLFLRIPKQVTGPGTLLGNNITGTGFFIISQILTTIVLWFRKKFLKFLIFGVKWALTDSGWMLFRTYMKGKAPMVKTFLKHMHF